MAKNSELSAQTGPSFIKKDIGDEVDRITGKDKVYDKQAADAKANRKEMEKEGTGNSTAKYARGGRVTGFKGYGAAKKV